MTKEIKNNNGFIEKHWVVSSFSNIETTRAPIGKYLLNNLSLEKNKSYFSKHELSELDIYNLKWVTELDARYMIRNFFKKSGNQNLFSKDDIESTEDNITPEGIRYINTIIQEAIGFYRRTLKRSIECSFFTQRQKWSDEKGPIFFKNTKDVIDFIRSNSINKWTIQNKQIICSLLKIAHAINIKNKVKNKLDKAEDILDEMSEKHIYPHFHDENHQHIDSEEMKWNVIKWEKSRYKTMITNDDNQISFRSSTRIKDDDMIILKMLSNPEYSDIDAIKDIYGKKNECKNKEDVLFLMQYHRDNVFNQNPDVEIKIKNIFGKSCEESKEFFETYKDQLDPKFYELLIKATTKPTTGKPGKNAEKYEDAKITGPLTDTSEEEHIIEVQFNLLNNKNETSFAHHRIYKMKTIIETIVRLQWYIRKAQIDYIIHAMLEEHKEIAKKEWLFPELFYLWWGKNGDDSKPAENAIYNHFVEEGIILPLSIPDLSEKRTFTTKAQRNRFHEKDYKNLYPDGACVKWNNKRHHEKIGD